ncbi:MAG: hypothetical protein FIA95_06285 [Gemmatimonadetes bacterium]|nr:hypothetical protein [Gemmatimonadota bacterium]
MRARPISSLTTLLFLAVLASALAPAPGPAQEREVWNDARVLELVRRARLERHSTLVDTAFRSYRGQARGYVYFFIDRADSDLRTLVKADQVALELSWRAPNATHQTIAGLRDEKVLPTNIRYHLDHLTVVLDDFGDQIRLGDGDEVAAVLHPMAPGGPVVYDYLLADSLTLRYGAGQEEVRVYEVRVRPKNPDGDGFIGSVFLDRAAAAIVRMSFTFTPASYVDPYLDYIRISLENSLWLGRYWLPYRQEAELRRELPQLDFLAGSIIRGRYEIGGYEFNEELPPAIFAMRGVTALPKEERESFPFEQGLFDDLELEGLAPRPSLEEIRAEARQILTRRALSGLSPRRLHLRSFSDALRFNRAEGLFVGGGVQLRPQHDALLRLSAGYALGRERPFLGLSATTPPDRVVPVLDVFWDEMRDIGPLPGTAPALGSVSALFGGEDFLDPYFARGTRLTFRGALPGAGPELSLRWERHVSAAPALSGDRRAVRPIAGGVLGSLEGRVPFPLPGAGQGSVRGTLGRLEDRSFGSLMAQAAWRRDGPERTWKLRAAAAAGASTLRIPPQMLFLLGGQGTIPGYDYRSFVGRRFWLARLEATHPFRPPWMGVRAFATLGATDLAGASTPTAWAAEDSGAVRAAVGAGLSLGWDVIRLDLARGLRDGRWQVMFSVDSRFHPWM